MGDCKTCTGCKEKKTKAELPENIPYIAYDMAQARNERHIKRMIVALIVAIALMFVSNAIWLWVWCQYDYSGETYTEEIVVEQDASDGGDTNYIGNNGDINNGVSKDSSNENEDYTNPN
jgi:hypothetical protein